MAGCSAASAGCWSADREKERNFCGRKQESGKRRFWTASVSARPGDPEKLGLAADSPAYVVWMAEQTVLGADQRGQESREAAEEGLVRAAAAGVQCAEPEPGTAVLPAGDAGAGVRRPLPHGDEKNGTPGNSSRTWPGAAAAYIKGMDGSLESVNGLLEVMESQLSYVPAFPGGSPDISLFDHARLTAAAASCIQAWAEEAQMTDYRKVFFENCKACSANKTVSAGVAGHVRHPEFYLYHYHETRPSFSAGPVLSIWKS